MLQAISWNQYIISILLLLIFYYSYVGIKYYKWELLGIIGIQRIEAGSAAISVDEFKEKLISERNENYLPKEPVYTPNFIQLFTDEFKAYLASTVDAIPSKTDMLNSLQAITEKYPGINFHGNNNSLHQYVHQEIEAIHPGLINPEDLANIFSR